MPRTSGYRSSWKPNKRPYITITPDAYITVQGETTIIGCGECRREIDINKYLTGISTEASVDSPPGSASFNLSIPDNQVSQFYVNDGFVVIPMMEIEIYVKGYYTIGGFPQYYRVFWGLVSNVSQSWSNGVTSVTVQCKDILRWWELTQSIVNPAFLDIGKSSSGYNMWGNKFAGANPYTIILILARESMGDFPLSDGSFLSFIPEGGSEGPALKEFGKGIMAYWQLKFANIWNRLVLYGSSGQAYTFQGLSGDTTPAEISNKIFEEEVKLLSLNPQTSSFKIQPHEIAAFKQELSRAGDVDFFQNEFQSKLSLAMTARDQAGGYEFYCDTTGDIVFKPPFYNMNVLPNKPVSWIQDFEIIDDSINDSEAEVYTHITSSGNAFGGVMDWGLNDDITTPRTGVVDYHLLRRYGWRRLNLQVEWAGNARKLFYHLLDHMDKINAKRVNGTITIPMRPELRMGFPVWIPKWDSFFYVQGISHNFSPGGQATTTLTLTARRSKFIAPKNIGIMKINPCSAVKDKSTATYDISFPSDAGESSDGKNSQAKTDGLRFDEPAVIRDPETGKLLGFPNAVMVYRGGLSGVAVTKLLVEAGSTKSKKPDGNKGDNKGSRSDLQGQVLNIVNSNQRSELIDQLRLNRYESGMSSAGTYDYAHDVEGVVKEFSVIPTTSIKGKKDEAKEQDQKTADARSAAIKQMNDAYLSFTKIQNELAIAYEKQRKELDARAKVSKANVNNNQGNTSPQASAADVTGAKIADLQNKLNQQQQAVLDLSASLEKKKLLPLNAMIRPVSDEFGFEVIGHYRYGRGTFIDRGGSKINISDVSKNSRTVNQLNIQFASTGGALTDVILDKTLGPESVSFAKAFEEMQPDDYRTGASFKGKQYNPNEMLESVAVTNQTQYTTAINQSITKESRTGVYAEADATRRAITLGELKPTFNGIASVDGRSAFNKCACGSGASRNLWLSVLPKEFLKRLLSPTTATMVDTTVSDTEKADDYVGETPFQLTPPPTGLTGDGDLRQRAVDLAKSLVGFNSGPGYADKSGKPVADRYKDFLFPQGLDDAWRADPNWGKTASCALTARAYLRTLGVQDPELTNPYQNGMAIEDLRNIGRRHGSITENEGKPVSGPINLKPGDIVFANKGSSQHTVIITEIRSQSDKQICVKTSEGGNDVYNGNIKIPYTDEQIDDLVRSAAEYGHPTTRAKFIAEKKIAPGIGSVNRCFNNINGAWYDGGKGGRAINFILDLEKTLADTSPSDVKKEVQNNVDAVEGANKADRPGPEKAELYGGSGSIATTGDNFSVDSARFFDLLYEYLTVQFAENYIAGNTPREKFAIDGNKAITTPPSFEQDNILKPTSTLFDRAAQGDPGALHALQYGSKFNFGQSEEALEIFEDQFKDGGMVDQLWQNTKDLAGQRFDPTSGNFQPSGTGGISISTSWQRDSGETSQWSASTSDLLPDSSAGETQDAQNERTAANAEIAKELTARAVSSGNTQSTKIPVPTIQNELGKKNALLPKKMQKGQWQPKSHPTLRVKLNTTSPEILPVGPILVKTS